MMSNICQHGQLARQCDRCELETELARVTAERDELRRRINWAPVAIVGPGSDWLGSKIHPLIDTSFLVGKRVALVEIE